ncbi:hypothetical protein [Bradyrhizobium sp. CCBAU 45394]|uniref:hypothetical protein n=1 Tax=Bradyrhizobium sp. CCBAU 45394 TaxID=1325087 RepID=UPI00230252C3|nr:hypothetical protein [Bradyrhizobium sp. CCBAU 45394]
MKNYNALEVRTGFSSFRPNNSRWRADKSFPDWSAGPSSLAAGDLLRDLFRFFLAWLAGYGSPARILIELHKGRDANLIAVVEVAVIAADQADMSIGLWFGHGGAIDTELTAESNYRFLARWN